MRIKTWQQRCEEHPDHDGIVSDGMIQARMQEEIDELRDALEKSELEQAMTDAIISGTGVMLGDKRIDPASIYKQPEQEPVAWMNPSWIDPDTRGWASDSFESIPIEGWVPLYTAPRQWKGLTDDEIKAPIQKAMQHFGYDPTQYSLGGLATIGFYGLVKEIEAKLQEKNT